MLSDPPVTSEELTKAPEVVSALTVPVELSVTNRWVPDTAMAFALVNPLTSEGLPPVPGAADCSPPAISALPELGAG